MTNKIYPSSLIVIDFSFSDEERGKISAAIGSELDGQLRRFLELEIGKYIAATISYQSAATPSAIKQKLTKLHNKTKSLKKELSILLDISEEEEIIKSAFEIEALDGAEVLSTIFGISIEDDDQKIPMDKNAALGNLIEFNLEELCPEEGMSVYFVYKTIELFEHSLENSKTKIADKGGAPGDPYLDGFLINLNKCYRLTGRDSVYGQEAIHFLDVARKIAADRLEKKGFKEAAQRLRYLDNEGLKLRIRDARKP